ncbi:MAG: DegV family protein [Acutalibacteraceae bacterium]
MIQIITDSAADFEPFELKKMGILCVPIMVYFGNDEYEENINLTKQQFYTLLKESADFPTTSQPSPYAFENVLRKVRDNGDEAVIITLSSALSGTCQSAALAKNMLEFDSCYVIDSLNSSGGERILAEQAVKMRDMGKSAAEIAACLELLKVRVNMFACIDTPEYLYKGGRISHTAYKIGSLAHIKPIIRLVQDGSIEIAAKPLGTKRCMDFLHKRLDRYPPDKNYPCYVMYTCNKQSGQALAEYLNESGYTIPENNIIRVGAAVGSHIGPNAFGLVYVKQIRNH